jgi:hypothetical protein
VVESKCLELWSIRLDFHEFWCVVKWRISNRISKTQYLPRCGMISQDYCRLYSVHKAGQDPVDTSMYAPCHVERFLYDQHCYGSATRMARGREQDRGWSGA